MPVDKSGISPCIHEEGDTMVLLHAAHAARMGCSKILIRIVDTDVVVLAVAYAAKMGIEELWVAFGVGKNYRNIAAHRIATHLGPDMCAALPFFNAVSGCDTVSAFAGRGKQTAFQTWKAYPEVTSAFSALSAAPVEVTQEQCQLIERFIVLMYSRTSSLKHVNEARQALFSQGTRSIENIPPTKAALYEHKKGCISSWPYLGPSPCTYTTCP